MCMWRLACLAVSVVHFCADYDYDDDDEQRRVRGGHTTAALTLRRHRGRHSVWRAARVRVCSSKSCATVPRHRVGGRVRGRPYWQGCCCWQWVLLLCYYVTLRRGRGRKGSKEETESGNARWNNFHAFCNIILKMIILLSCEIFVK